MKKLIFLILLLTGCSTTKPPHLETYQDEHGCRTENAWPGCHYEVPDCNTGKHYTLTDAQREFLKAQGCKL